MIIRVALPVLLFAGWIGWTMPGDPSATAAVRQTAVAAPATDLAPWSGDVVLDRQSDGHFYADINVDGQSVRFLVDTGASLPALTAADAQRIGHFVNANEVTTIGQGASGAVAGKRITIGRMAIGNKRADNIDAVIVTSGLSVSLLGQSFLARFGSVTITDDKMVLR